MTTSSTKDELVERLVRLLMIDRGRGPRLTIEQWKQEIESALSQSHGEVRAAALEEAAKIADVEYDKVRIGDGEFGGGRANASRIIAGQIRAISKQSGTP